MVCWIPRVVAQRAMLSTGAKPVVGHDVYVGPLANLFGFIWSLCGWPTEDC